MESGDERAPLLLKKTILQPSTQHTLACAAVIAANLLERLAYYSIAGNLVFFLYGEPLCWAISLATVTILVLTAITYYLGLLSGWLSDSYFGRYWIIVTGYIIYIFGYIVFIYVSFYFEKFEIHDFQNVTYEGTSCNSTWQKDTRPPVCADGNSPNCLTALYVGVILVAIGAGTVRTNLASFGGDQARSGGIKSTHRFFTGYYWSLNLGAILALVAVAYIEDFNFFYGFIVAGSSLLLSFLLFLLGTKLYIRRPAGAINVFKIVYRVISNACYVKRNSNIQDDGTVHNFLDYANMEHEGGKFNVNQIEDVRRLWKLCKVFLLTIPYWMCYSQMVFNLFLLQGLHLHVRFDHFNECLSNNISDEIKSKGASANLCDHLPFIDYTDKKGTPPIPPASLAAFNAIFIVLFLSPDTKVLQVSL
ncbi:SLC15A4 [Bugula neritina]|uniref:SLC15A4 n=1 Tax=Bugula neritina TaxID=10212 RepID=A0A7J7J7R4_BUGNE|nr:SLC15A4 [Bugula neritina]